MRHCLQEKVALGDRLPLWEMIGCSYIEFGGNLEAFWAQTGWQDNARLPCL